MENNQNASECAIKLGTIIKEQYPEFLQAPSDNTKETKKAEMLIKSGQLSRSRSNEEGNRI